MREHADTPWARGLRIAGEQHGCITYRQLRGCGCSSSALSRAVAGGRLFRVHKGVYAMGRPPSTAKERVMAAVLACGPGALLSQLWALWLYGLARLPDGPIDVTVPGSREGPAGVRLHRGRGLVADESDGIPVTTPARTLVDCVPLLSEQQLRRAVSDVQIKGLTGVEAIREELERTRGRHVAPLARLVSDDLHAVTRSMLEDLLHDMARDGGWPRPDINKTVCGIEVDFSYPRWNLIFLADGYRFHGNKVKWEDDHEDRLFLEANGQRVVAVSYDQVTRRRARTRERLERIIQSYR